MFFRDVLRISSISASHFKCLFSACHIFTSAEEGGYAFEHVRLFVCLSARLFKKL